MLVHVAEERRGVLNERDRRLVGEGIGGAVGFLGGSAAFLLGVLMLASLSHFNDTGDVVDSEALAYSAAFDGTVALAHDDQAKIRRDLVCLMRSVATKSWSASEAEDATGSENTHAWRTRALEDTNAVVPKTLAQEDSLATVQSELLEAAKAGQHRLIAARNDLPGPLWIVVYISLFLLIVALTVLLRPHPALAITSLGAILLLSSAIVWTLTAFAQPFTKDGIYLSPHAINDVMVRLQSAYPDADWGPCAELSRS
jgi:hypothetical protein